MHPNLLAQYIQIQQQIERYEFLALLFRNIEKNQDQKLALQTTLSTLIYKPHDKRTTDKLHGQVYTSFEVNSSNYSFFLLHCCISLTLQHINIGELYIGSRKFNSEKCLLKSIQYFFAQNTTIYLKNISH